MSWIFSKQLMLKIHYKYKIYILLNIATEPRTPLFVILWLYKSNSDSKPRFQKLSPVCCCCPAHQAQQAPSQSQMCSASYKDNIFIKIVGDIWPEHGPLWSLSHPHSPSRDQHKLIQKNQEPPSLRHLMSARLSASNHSLLLLHRSSTVDMIPQTVSPLQRRSFIKLQGITMRWRFPHKKHTT